MGPITLPGNKASDGSEWRTVMIGGLRQGGPIYYALDMTDEAVTDVSQKYLWEFPPEDFASDTVMAAHATFMGDTYG